jgi:hypothetical protein
MSPGDRRGEADEAEECAAVTDPHLVEPCELTMHRLLERDADDLGGPSIVCLGGLAKPSGSAADARDYRAIMQFASEFQKCRTVL